ncbi:hypothetical protein SM124_07385 [Bacillus sp. 31A1R]|uniref:Uncharacterized protein n=1 Tax=Robertmurraya mangrovi TaxID=3098077 RepID=A0ABU5IWM6_9BACI|nr:hypothetical protein [Bacillus sp. 31A1R]MDZ5471568.1 hypothetical protein [Bacillus sp. 31A1R]
MDTLTIRIIFILGLITDLFLTLYLFRIMDEIGVGAFILLVVLLFGGTIFMYFILRRNIKTKR